MRVVKLSDLEQFTAVNLLSEDLGVIGGPVIVPSCAQVVLRWNLSSGKVGHNVLYGRYSGAFAGTVGQCNAIMTALTSGGAWTALNNLLSTGGSFAGVDIRNVNVKDQPIISSTNAPIAGADATGAMPSEVAACITLRTAKAGRANRGRLYLPNLAISSASPGNVIAGATMTALTNWANTIIGALAPSGYVLVIGQKARAAYTSPKTGTHFDQRDATSETVTQCTPRDNHWDSQRRRGLK